MTAPRPTNLLSTRPNVAQKTAALGTVGTPPHTFGVSSDSDNHSGQDVFLCCLFPADPATVVD